MCNVLRKQSYFTVAGSCSRSARESPDQCFRFCWAFSGGRVNHCANRPSYCVTAQFSSLTLYFREPQCLSNNLFFFFIGSQHFFSILGLYCTVLYSCPFSRRTVSMVTNAALMAEGWSSEETSARVASKFAVFICVGCHSCENIYTIFLFLLFWAWSLLSPESTHRLMRAWD